MNAYRKLIERFKARSMAITLILDGYGIGTPDKSNAIHLARTPVMDDLLRRFPHTQLAAHGTHVGLPSDKDLGGSEVGHLSIGAGFVVNQGATLISEMITSGSFFEQPVLQEALRQGKQGSLHLIGLLSDANIHSHIDHMLAIVAEAAQQGVRRCYLHALLDGRDTPIQSALDYVHQTEKLLYECNKTPGYDYRFVSGGGRERISMDRNQEWHKVQLGWEAHVNFNSGAYFDSMEEAILHFRSEAPGIIDQDLPPFNIYGPERGTTRIEDGDAVIFWNFRGDRAVELSRAFSEPDFDAFEKSRNPSVYFAGMSTYDEDTNLPENRLVESPSVENPFGKRILEYGCRQFRLAESQKFPHVTFFFNGGYRLPLDPQREDYFCIESDAIPSFDAQPAMKAAEIATKAAAAIRSGHYDFGLINLANCDMVGHSGSLEATIAATEAVDAALGEICRAVRESNAVALITADHGNADCMLSPNKQGEQERNTRHTLNPVPCIVYDPYQSIDFGLKESQAGVPPLNLSMLAATTHILMGHPVPDDLLPPLFAV